MYGEIFYWVFNMSISATICGLLVLLIRCIDKIPRRVITVLWLIPFIRMCIPFSISGKYGLMPLLTKFTSKAVIFNESTDFTALNHITKAESYFPITYKSEFLRTVFSVSAVIWILFSALLLIFLSCTYMQSIREIRNAEHSEKNIFISESINSPAVYGIIRPKIVIPKTKHNDLNYILMHENMHIKRHANLTRLIATAITCFHWFNPFCLLFLKLFLADIELACDERVLAKLSTEEQKEYANALLSSVETAAVLPSPFGGAKIKNRIENILSYKKLTAISSIGFILFIAAVAYALLIN